jgi:flagellin
MPKRIESGVVPLRPERSLDQNTGGERKTARRGFSGEKGEAVWEDAVALAGSGSADIRSFTQSLRNVNEGIAIISVAEKALDSLANIAQQLCELARKASELEKGEATEAFQTQACRLSAEYSQVAAGAQPIVLDQYTSRAAPDFNSSCTGTRSGDLLIKFGVKNEGRKIDPLRALDLVQPEAARTAVRTLNAVIDGLNREKENHAKAMQRLQTAAEILNANREAAAGSALRIKDPEAAVEISGLVRSRILSSCSLAVRGQANQQPALAAELLS